MKDIERVLGYPLPRISLPDYDYEGGASCRTRSRRPVVNRGGGRMGRAADLSPEELANLLRVG
jgi:hypothetical protein